MCPQLDQENQMVVCTITRYWPGWMGCVLSWTTHSILPYRIFVVDDTVLNLGIIHSLQEAFEATTEPIIAFLHDDLMITEPGWDSRIVDEFEADPAIGVIGFGGALRHGAPTLYTEPYHLPNLGRAYFMSNMREAESHGTRFTGECEVAVLDGFALFVRRDILERAGGWNFSAGYFMYSEWLCCEARRQGYKIRLVGVECDHLGGKTASMVQLKDDHAAAHVWLYETFSDVLPFAVGGA